MNPINAKEFSEEFGESTTKLVALGFLTFGIYYFIWLAERRKPLNRIANREIYDYNLLIYAAICGGLPAVISSLNLTPLIPVIFLLEITYSLLMIIISWKLGKWLEVYARNSWHTDWRANGFLLVIFNIFYVNYLINKVGEFENVEFH